MGIAIEGVSVKQFDPLGESHVDEYECAFGRAMVVLYGGAGSGQERSAA